MSVIIYEWPPQLEPRQQRWTVRDPIQSSRSLLTGRRYVSAHGRRRRLVQLEVSTRNEHGYGVMEGLIDRLKGGVNLVKFRWYGPTDVRGDRHAGVVWDVNWDVGWANIVGTPEAADPPSVRLTNLAVSKRVARAGEYLRYGNSVRRIIADVTSNAAGAGIAYLDAALPFDGAQPVALPAQSSGVFEVEGIPEVPWTWNAEQSVNWTMAEVFTDEIGAFSYRAPWGYA